jgi:quinol monooxygenase YgiN
MIVYEVNIRIERAISEEYRAWLAEHVRELLTLPGFLSAEVFECLPDPDDAEHESLVVCYRLQSHAALTAYLAHHAPAMRAKGTERFGDRMQVSRRVLAPLVEMLAVEGAGD